MNELKFSQFDPSTSSSAFNNFGQLFIFISFKDGNFIHILLPSFASFGRQSSFKFSSLGSNLMSLIISYFLGSFITSTCSMIWQFLTNKLMRSGSFTKSRVMGAMRRDFGLKTTKSTICQIWSTGSGRSPNLVDCPGGLKSAIF